MVGGVGLWVLEGIDYDSTISALFYPVVIYIHRVGLQPFPITRLAHGAPKD